MNNDLKNKVLQIIEHYRPHNQLKKFNEETYEFIEAINDYQFEYVISEMDKEYLRQYKDHILEEMADCFVLLFQFKEFYEIDSDDLKRMIKYKIDRTLERMKSE